ncbi:hypothetical protein BC835DRAFT_232412 [Cytidiella melzeri]|nr:hypothetical protein BC835DRAFT_232412 [Cytidiella melzeri]
MSANTELSMSRYPLMDPEDISTGSSNAEALFTSPGASGSSLSESFALANTNVDLSYSPPPSPTRISSVSRFSTPLITNESGTPSLVHLSLPSTISSPSLAYTPVQYATTRQQPDSSQVGLGLSGLFFEDGAAFDGLGSISMRQEGEFMNDIRGCAGQDSSFAYAEQMEEDAWRKGISSSVDGGAVDVLRGLDEVGSSWPRQPGMMESPTMPSADDVFYSHAPMMSSTPRSTVGAGRDWKRRSGMSRAVVTSWSRDVQRAARGEFGQGGMGGF